MITVQQEISKQAPAVLAYSRRQSAAALGISIPLLDRLLADEKIRSIKLGDRRLIPAEEINRVLREGI
jgi:excisionase family DNA binding protein